ncbi:SDR family NAD(P)-dependent oxidoreductase [Streptomyces sp. PT12]|uniref:SDR family NAD(P)-dependent oxidoreductase n=1 Tax=Streptomyces sp. PT12 TaxID=1510197 RepID=UPI001C674881|nr:SDR family NAD(P)-dependent oxidoreductase [Streptomyces sp. PT12]
MRQENTVRQRAVVTGATSGIGEAIVRRLAEASATVVMVGRAEERLEQARRRVHAAVPHADLRTERADLSLLSDVRALAKRLDEQEPPTIVISNAAVIAPVADVTSEGLQRILVTNHLAPYLLLRSLVATVGERPARFVVVGASPTGLTRAPVDLDDLSCSTGRGLGPIPSFRPFVSYGRTKNMNAMFVYSLAERLAGTRITVNGVHPGIIKGTRLGHDAQRGTLRLMTRALRPFSGRPDAGADTPVWLATSPDVENVTGRFFVKRAQVTTAPHTTEPARLDRLWEESAHLTGLPPIL